MLEAINVKSHSTNDLTKAKLGIKPEGIKVVSDKENIIENPNYKIPGIEKEKGERE